MARVAVARSTVGPAHRRRPLLALALGTALALSPLLMPGAADARSGPVAGRPPCLHLEGITAFAPRGEVYVELRAACGPGDFTDESSLLAYVEVLPSDLPPVGEDVRVFEDDPRGRTTLVFRDLSIASGDVVLVRLVRFGEILGLQTIRVP
jgi:hypothetical protein